MKFLDRVMTPAGEGALCGLTLDGGIMVAFQGRPDKQGRSTAGPNVIFRWCKIHGQAYEVGTSCSQCEAEKGNGNG